MATERLREWANSGTVTDPGDPTIDTGWVQGEQPPEGKFNFTNNRQDVKINEMIGTLPDITYNDTNAQQMLATQLFGVVSGGWGTTAETENRLSAAGTIQDCQAYFINGKRYVALLTTANTVEIWDPDTLTKFEDSGNLTTVTNALPTGSGQTWTAQSMCTNGTDFYVTFTDTNASPDDHRIQGYTRGGTWTKASGWPTSGTFLGQGNANLTPDTRVIAASGSQCVTINSFQTITSSASAVLRAINFSNGLITSTGAGDATATSTTVQSLAIASDGTNIFFTYDGGVATATIADLTVGASGVAFPTTDPTNTQTNTLTHVGNGLIVAGLEHTGSPGGGAARAAIQTLDASASAVYDSIQIGSDANGLSGDYNLWSGVRGACFDGKSLWFYVVPYEMSEGSQQHVSTRVAVDVSQLMQVPVDTTTGTERLLAQVVTRQVIVKQDSAFTAAQWASSYDYFPICFDGRDIWGPVQNFQSSAYRIPFATLRG